MANYGYEAGAYLHHVLSQTRLEADHGHLKCRRFCKPTFSRPMPVDLASTIQKECDAVVLALAD